MEPIEWIIAAGVLIVAGGTAAGVYEAGKGAGDAANTFAAGAGQGAGDAAQSVGTGLETALVLGGVGLLAYGAHKAGVFK